MFLFFDFLLLFPSHFYDLLYAIEYLSFNKCESFHIYTYISNNSPDL